LLQVAAKSVALFDSKKQAAVITDYKQRVGRGVQEALRRQFAKFNLTGKTWAALTKAQDEYREGETPVPYQNIDGSGPLRRGAHRYQVLVPSYTVMFAFFLVVTVGWVFVAERRQGTLKRLRVAPVRRRDILLGKLVPYFLLSIGQGAVLLLCGKLFFGMRWGPDDWPLWQQVLLLTPVIFATSLAAMGLALLVAAVSRSELQVALYGAIPVLVLALIGGCMLPREWMPEQTQELSLLTPHGWALNAYRELLDVAGAEPNLKIVGQSSAALIGFGLGFVLLAGLFLRLD
jgi:ABC-2 type transport system permease protein